MVEQPGTELVIALMMSSGESHKELKKAGKTWYEASRLAQFRIGWRTFVDAVRSTGEYRGLNERNIKLTIKLGWKR